MQVLFKAQDHKAHGLRDWALGRAGFVLRRMAGRVSHASLRFSDVDGPRHGVDKRCQVEIVSIGAAPVVVTATARDWRAALNRALARAAETLWRVFERRHDARRAQRRLIRSTRAEPAGGRAD